MDTIEAVKNMGNQVPPDVRDQLILSELISIKQKLATNGEQLRRIEQANNERLAAIEQANSDRDEYPSILWLLRHKTWKTSAAIAIVFILLSTIWISSIRAAALERLGWPVF